MTFNLTSEQIRENKNQDKYLAGFMFLLFVAMMILISWPTLSKGTQDLPKLIGLWSFMIVVLGLGIYAGLSGIRSKRVTQIIVEKNILALVSAKGKEEISSDSILGINVFSRVNGEVRSVLLKTAKKPFVLLKGFDEMAGLAREIEKMAPSTAAISRETVNPNPQSRLGRILLMAGIITGILGLVGGMIFLLIKMGFGFLATPLCIVLIGVSKFRQGRGNRKERLKGILIIFGAILWAVFEFMSIIYKSRS